MRIFLTGATGFIGSQITPLLLGAGHKVLGLTRSDAGAEALRKAGAEPHRGTLEDPDSLADGALQADAVIHCAFDHDFSNFMANCEKDRRAIAAMGAVLKGTDKPFVITSGTGMGAAAPGQLATEAVFHRHNPNPRAASEIEGEKQRAEGVKVVVMRLPQVHDTQKQGLVSPFIEIARAKGVSAYVGDGANRWPGAHVCDVALLYKLAVEQGQAGERFHAVDEEGVAARDIATVVGKGLGVPVKSLNPDQAAEHFGWMGLFVGMDMPASSAWTRERLGWTPEGPGIIADLEQMDYGVVSA
ncbi:MAG TPA: SDR family oxidoreductase [Caulobacteraceae bacterium]|jgi:nucleoside-diphosphate-sugar epimerase|nr:SDR family oxidoreductase [Caulobacteraceae bacterium]